MLVLPETPIVTSLICGTVFPGGRSHWLGSLKVVQCQLVSREREKQAIFLLVLGCGVHPKLSISGKRIGYAVCILSGLHLVFSSGLTANASEYFQTVMCFLSSFC